MPRTSISTTETLFLSIEGLIDDMIWRQEFFTQNILPGFEHLKGSTLSLIITVNTILDEWMAEYKYNK